MHPPCGDGSPCPFLEEAQHTFVGGAYECWGQSGEAREGAGHVPILVPPAGYSIKCEYSAHKEGVLKEEMLLACEGGTGAFVRVMVQARVMGE
jgi:hypothetical protein